MPIESKSLGDLLAYITQNGNEPLRHLLMLTYEFDPEQALNLMLGRELDDNSGLNARHRLTIAGLHPIIVYDAAYKAFVTTDAPRSIYEIEGAKTCAEVDDILIQAIKDLTKAGIIVVGITIGDSKAVEAFPYATNIQDLADLGPALFEATSKIFK